MSGLAAKYRISRPFATVQNVFNDLYFDYAVASSATFGRPIMPGSVCQALNLLVKAGATF